MRAVKPIPYRADYFGSKLHVEQNEKLEMCGVIMLVEIDTDSLQLLGHLSPSKVTYKYVLYLFFSLSNTITVYLVFLLIYISGHFFYESFHCVFFISRFQYYQKLQFGYSHLPNFR